MSPVDAAALARAFHEAYERLAPSFGYETRKESAVPWAEVPEQNKALMTAVCEEVVVSLLAVREAELEQARLQAVKGVMALMREAGTLSPSPDTIVPYSNGYGCWFIGEGQLGTASISAEEIAQRIEARGAAVPDGPVSE